MSTAATDTNGRASCLTADPTDFKNAPTDMRSARAARRQATIQAVPDAVKKFTVNVAGYGPAVFTAGAIRVISLCKPGQPNTVVH